LAKKKKRVEPKYVPTKHQLSKWQRQKRIRRIIVIAAAAFLAGIIGWVGYGYYKSEIEPLKEIVIEVNNASFNMDYYVKTFDAYTKGMEPSLLYYMPDIITNQIVQDELIRQGANNSLGIEVTDKEIDKKIEEDKLPKDKIYCDIVAVGLLGEKIQEYFASALPDTMEQAHVQVMLVESQEVADAVMAKIESSGNFTAPIDEFSCNSQTEGDLGWLPQELMPNPLIEELAFSIKPGELGKVYDESTTKDIGYWLIEVTDKNEEKGIKVRAMLLGNKTEADEVKAKLAGGNFTALAKEYSQHDSKDDGGELGWLKQGDMNSETFDETAFSLPLNEISEPVQDKTIQTAGGYWIVKVLAREERELEEVAKTELVQKALNEWFQEQWESSIINDYIDAEKRAWAVNRVLKGRTAS
jgi:parvulin-like peptidyl-prolyl isomerase